jgi:hypothetical protein
MSVDPLQSQAGEKAEAPPYGTISADRLREVVDRLESSFYDRPEVLDRIARALIRDLGPPPRAGDR